jgi:hypothetical protein
MLSKMSICALTRTCSVTLMVGSRRRRMSAEVMLFSRQLPLLRRLHDAAGLLESPIMPFEPTSENGMGKGERGPVVVS